MIVVDTNVIAYLLIKGARTSEAEGVLRFDSDWSAPALWRSEFRSTLSKYLRIGHLSLDGAETLMNEAEEILQRQAYEPMTKSVLALATASGCSSYDCEFVALAQDLGVTLITDDDKVLQAFPNIAKALVSFVKP